MLQRKYMEKNRSIARTVSIEAVLQPRFYYAMSYFSFDAEVLFAFFVFGDTFFMLELMVHIGLGSDRRRLAGFSDRFSRSLTSWLLSSSSSMWSNLSSSSSPFCFSHQHQWLGVSSKFQSNFIKICATFDEKC